MNLRNSLVLRTVAAHVACLLTFLLLLVPFGFATGGRMDQVLEDAELRLALVRGRVLADLNEVETAIVAVHFIFQREDTELVARAKLRAVVYQDANPGQQKRLVVKTLPGSRLGFQFTPRNHQVLEVMSPLLRNSVRFRLMEPYRSRNPALNDLRFVPD